MKLCAFCGKPGGNKEHIIAQWLIDHMQAKDYQVVVGHQKEDMLRTRPAHGLRHFITKEVCPRCNNEWMSKLETWFKHSVGPLVGPHWPKLACEVLAQALREHEMLAKWALKTAVMMDSNTMMESVIDDATARELFQGRIASGVIVEVAHLKEKQVGGLLSRGFWIKNGGQKPQWQVHTGKMAFKAIIQLNHLAIRVFRAPGAQPTYLGLQDRFPLRCYPETQNPYRASFTFHDLLEFDRSLQLETSLGA